LDNRQLPRLKKDAEGWIIAMLLSSRKLVIDVIKANLKISLIGEASPIYCLPYDLRGKNSN